MIYPIKCLASAGDEKQMERKGKTASQPSEKRTDEGAQQGPRREIRCYHCNGLGHIMAHCPKKNQAACPRALFGESCGEVAWNTESDKYLRWGMLDGRAVQMLIDTGCDNGGQQHSEPIESGPSEQGACIVHSW